MPSAETIGALERARRGEAVKYRWYCRRTWWSEVAVPCRPSDPHSECRWVLATANDFEEVAS